MQYIALDVHKRYTWARVEGPDGVLVREKRVVHRRGALREFLAGAEPGSPVAVETVGNWYWVAEEVEAAGCTPQLVAAGKAKLMRGAQNKTSRARLSGVDPATAGGDATGGVGAAAGVAGHPGAGAGADGAGAAAHTAS